MNKNINNIFYITYNDSPSGVYKSQVIDVVKLYNKNKCNIKLISLISIRNFWKNRQRIKSNLPDALVLPFFPKVKNWKINKWLLKFLISDKNNQIIARGVIATNLCIEIEEKFEKIIYDGRGAIAAEYEEYGEHNNLGNKDIIEELERRSVKNSDFRVAVSEKLIEYWQDRYDYHRGNEVVIPCSLSMSHCTGERTLNFPLLEGLKKDDILLVYSGSIAGWQSFEVLSNILERYLTSNEKVKILFLSKEHIEIDKITDKYQDRVYRKWVSHEKVNEYLQLGDYGLLVREENITNSVASPVKFAEYLISGLNILITSSIGDYSKFVEEYKCGFIIDTDKNIVLNKTSQDNKKKNIELGKKFFSKSSIFIINAYKNIL